MSYRLADGSMSTDYKIGDKFTHSLCGAEIWELVSDDGSLNPYFNRQEYLNDNFPRHWRSLTPVKTKQHASVINQLHETIRQLKATIKELES
jgi:hypothetical protein